MDGKDECVQVEGYDRALCMSWKGDNAGPPSVEEVRGYPRMAVSCTSPDSPARLTFGSAARGLLKGSNWAPPH